MTLIRALTVVGLLAASVPAHADPMYYAIYVWLTGG
jgi:hypothetical protein